MEERLRLSWWNQEKDVWQMIHNSYPDRESDRVVASLPHLSYFSVVEFTGAAYLIDKGKCYVYPQPAKGDLSFGHRRCEIQIV